jgi:DNA-binding transcriptional LysR family regulator
MPEMDLNLLSALDVLLAERSITRAARQLGLSASAMSRTLTRLRDATGDQLLVRAGREMILTPHAEALRTRTRAAVLEAKALLSPAPDSIEMATLRRTFRIRANEAFVEVFGATLIAAVAAQAPLLCLHFSGKPERKPAYLRDGDADLEIGVVEEMDPRCGSVRCFANITLAPYAPATRLRRMAPSVRHATPPLGMWRRRMAGGLPGPLMRRWMRRAFSAAWPRWSRALRRHWQWYAPPTWWRYCRRLSWRRISMPQRRPPLVPTLSSFRRRPRSSQSP